MPRASTRPGDLRPTDAVRQQVQVSLEKARRDTKSSRLQTGLGRLAQVTARRTRSMTKPVSRAISTACPAYAARDRPGRQGGRRETRSRHGRTGHRRAARLLGLKQKKTRRGAASLRRPLRASRHGRTRHSADLATSGTRRRLCAFAHTLRGQRNESFSSRCLAVASVVPIDDA